MLRPLLKLSREKGVTLRLWKNCGMMEVARENARHELPTKVNLLYKVKESI